MRRLEIEKITINGFKSIQSLDDFAPRQINVLIGQNGAGKSNFIGFFKFLSNILSGTGNLSEYAALNGGASVFLFDGPEVTTQIQGNISLKTTTGINDYKFRLSHASSDTFVFTEEQFRYTSNGRNQNQIWYDLGAGHKESALINAEVTGRTQGTVKTVTATHHLPIPQHHLQITYKKQQIRYRKQLVFGRGWQESRLCTLRT